MLDYEPPLLHNDTLRCLLLRTVGAIYRGHGCIVHGMLNIFGRSTCSEGIFPVHQGQDKAEKKTRFYPFFVSSFILHQTSSWVNALRAKQLFLVPHAVPCRGR
eukprot:scaffold6926_cov100-Cylindrotheca_fusiformis.AAC.5